MSEGVISRFSGAIHRGDDEFESDSLSADAPDLRVALHYVHYHSKAIRASNGDLDGATRDLTVLFGSIRRVLEQRRSSPGYIPATMTVLIALSRLLPDFIPFLKDPQCDPKLLYLEISQLTIHFAHCLDCIVEGTKTSKNFIFGVVSKQTQSSSIWVPQRRAKNRAIARLHEAEVELSVKTDAFQKKLAFLTQGARTPTHPVASSSGTEALIDMGMKLPSLSAPPSISQDHALHLQSLGASLKSAVHVGPEHNIPGERNAAFFGREYILRGIHDLIDSKGGHLRRPTPCIGLFGMRGVGKTEVALQYARSCVDDANLKYVFVLRAGSLESLHEDFVAIEKLLFGATKDIASLSAPRTTIAIAQKVVGFLEHTEDDWLLIYDDVQDWKPRTLIRWPSTCISKSAVLFTSQVSNNVDPWILKPILVLPFDTDTGSSFLQTLMSDRNEYSAELVTTYLGGHPESLICAVRFCKRLGLSLLDCRKQLTPENLRGWWQAADEVRSCSLSLFLQQDLLTSQARRLLHVLCMLNYNCISEEIVQDQGMRDFLGIGNEELSLLSLYGKITHHYIAERSPGENSAFIIPEIVRVFVLEYLRSHPDELLEAFSVTWDMIVRQSRHGHTIEYQAHLVSLVQLRKLYALPGRLTDEQVDDICSMSTQIVNIGYSKDARVILKIVREDLKSSTYDIVLMSRLQLALARALDEGQINDRRQALAMRREAIASLLTELPAANVRVKALLMEYTSVGLFDLVENLLEFENIHSAQETLDQGFDLLQSLGDEEMRPGDYATYQRRLAIIAAFCGDLDASLHHILNALRMASSASLTTHEYELYKALILMGQERWSESLESLLKCKEECLATMGRGSDYVIKTLLPMGILFLRREEFDDAILCLQDYASMQQSRENPEGEACALYYLSVAYEKTGKAEKAAESRIKAEAAVERLVHETHHLQHLKDAEASAKLIHLLRPSARFLSSVLNETGPSPNGGAKLIEYHSAQTADAIALGPEQVNLTLQKAEIKYLPQTAPHSVAPKCFRYTLTETSLPTMEFSQQGKIVSADLSRASTSLSLTGKAASTIERTFRATTEASTATTSSIVPGLALGVATGVAGLATVNTIKTVQQVKIARRAADASERSATMAERVGKENLKLIDLQKIKTQMDIDEARTKKSSQAASRNSNGTDNNNSDADDDADDAGNDGHNQNMPVSSTRDPNDSTASQSPASDAASPPTIVANGPKPNTSSRYSSSIHNKRQEGRENREKERLLQKLAAIRAPKAESQPGRGGDATKHDTKHAVGPNEQRLNATLHKENRLAASVQNILSEHLEQSRRLTPTPDVKTTTESMSSSNTEAKSSTIGDGIGDEGSDNANSYSCEPASEGADVSGPEAEPKSDKGRFESSGSEHHFGAQDQDAPENEGTLCSIKLNSASGAAFKGSGSGSGVGRVGHGSDDIELVNRTGPAPVCDSHEEQESRNPTSKDV